MANTILNSAEGNTYFTSAGVAISATTQPRLNSTVMAGTLDSSIKPADVGLISTSPQIAYTGYDRTSIIRGLSNTIKGVVGSTAIRSPASDFHREGIRQLDASKVYLRASGIRNNQWSTISGRWINTPGILNDFSALGNDDEADSNRAIPGAFTWAWAGSGLNENYPPRTQ